MTRVNDDMVRRWLAWAVNYGEIASYERTREGWLIRGRENVRLNDMEPFFQPGVDDYVPFEMVLKPREALAFVYGLALGGSSKDRREWTQEDWERRAEQREAPSA